MIIVRNADLNSLVSVPTGELICSLNLIIFTIILLHRHYHFSRPLPPSPRVLRLKKCWRTAKKGYKNFKFGKVLTHDSLSSFWIQCNIKGHFVKLIIGVMEVKQHNQSLSYTSRVKWPFHSTPWPLEFTTSIYFLSIPPFHALPRLSLVLDIKNNIVYTHCKDLIILARLKHPDWISIDSLLGKAGRGLGELPDIWHPQT